MRTERVPAIRPPEQAAALKCRYHPLHKIIERARKVWRQDIEAVRGFFDEPLLERVGDIRAWPALGLQQIARGSVGPTDGVHCFAALYCRTQVVPLCDRRNYDRNITGLGMGRTPRYLLMALKLPDRLFGVSKLEALESNSAVLHAIIRYSNAVLGLGRIDEGELHEEVGIASTG
jgi:hypothetical protein